MNGCINDRISHSAADRERIVDEVGLRRPRPGSLGVAYTFALVAGAVIAAVAGGTADGKIAFEAAVFVSLVIWQPLIEELLFRGVIQGVLLRTSRGAANVAGISLANVLASLAFVLLHFVNQPPLWALGVFVPSLVFGFFRDRTGSVLPSLILHSVYNAAFFLS